MTKEQMYMELKFILVQIPLSYYKKIPSNITEDINNIYSIDIVNNYLSTYCNAIL